jgi:hypothetical protein
MANLDDYVWHYNIEEYLSYYLLNHRMFLIVPFP